ncbi:MAG: tRNA 2-selenouridine(34) synthase MnmH [Bdellovibrionota bacterium]
MLQPKANARFLDVRSPGEFGHGSIPSFSNIPILSDQERHEVGLCYKQKGQEAAIALGQSLVAGHREKLIQSWKSELQGATQAFVACWRGGIRSGYTVEWLKEAGVESTQIAGGYKALRKELMQELEHLPPLCVVAGPTGSTKTKLLREFPEQNLDLEFLAKHRGSAFGQYLNEPQPAHATFENVIGLELKKKKVKSLLIEDESMMIGQVHLPPALRAAIAASPVVLIQMDIEMRAQNIYEEYVTEPMEAGHSAQELNLVYQQSIHRIQKKLGGLLTNQVLGRMSLAFLRGAPELHREWIKDLLEHYYDNAYAYSFARAGRKIAFEGDWNKCQNWIQKQFA